MADNEAKAVVRSLRVSPQKLNLVAQSIRGKNVQIALRDLEFSRRRISQQVKVGLESAIANAENNHQLDLDILKVSEAYCGKGMVMKRWRARAKGRPGRIEKFLSNITIKVAEVQNDKEESK